jgi:hypothetical protein
LVPGVLSLEMLLASVASARIVHQSIESLLSGCKHCNSGPSVGTFEGNTVKFSVKMEEKKIFISHSGTLDLAFGRKGT